MGKHLNGQKINARVAQDSILGQLLFLIFINDFSEEITSVVKLFAGNTSLFLVIQNKSNSAF